MSTMVKFTGTAAVDLARLANRSTESLQPGGGWRTEYLHKARAIVMQEPHSVRLVADARSLAEDVLRAHRITFPAPVAREELRLALLSAASSLSLSELESAAITDIAEQLR